MKPVMKIYNVINIIHIKHLVYSLVHSKCSTDISSYYDDDDVAFPCLLTKKQLFLFCISDML